MSCGIVRVQKFSAGSVKGIEIHDRRDKDFSHTNKDIDFERSKENYDLHQGNEGKTFYSASKERIDGLHLKKAVRKDAVVMAQVLVTSDKAFFDGLSEGETKQFFRDSYEFLCNRYGKENAISATVHMDERTPHMHFNFVPVTADGRLSAKDVLTRKSLTEQQTAFFEQVGKAYGLKRGEPKDSGKRRIHLKTDEYKTAMGEAQKITALANEIQNQAKNARLTLDKVNARIETLENKKNGLECEIDTLESKLFTSREVQALDEKASRTLTGGLKGVSYREYQKLKETAEVVDGVRESAWEQINKLEAEIKKLQGHLGETLGYLEKYFPQAYHDVKNRLFSQQSTVSLGEIDKGLTKIKAAAPRQLTPNTPQPRGGNDER